MLILGLVVLIILAFLFFRSPFKRNGAVSKGQSFAEPIPKDYQIYSSNFVSGVSFRKKDVLRFINGKNQKLSLEPEFNNPHDKNAIKVIGITSSSEYFIGYVPKEVSAQIVATGMLDKIIPRLTRAYHGRDDYLEVQFQIIGLKSLKKEFDAFIDNKPAESRQKDYYKFFNITIPRGLTKGDADITIDKHSKTLRKENDAQLQEYYEYISILDEFDDSDFREEFEIKKPARTFIDDALNALRQEGKSYGYLSDNINEVVDMILQIKPELMSRKK